MKKIMWIAGALLLMVACRQEELPLPSTDVEVAPARPQAKVKGLFLLNEGNMGSNKASLDYFDYTRGTFSKNIYPSRNPGVVMELGDVGNDIAIYGNRLYAVINCSNLVEVMDLTTARHIGQVSIPNCRDIVFKDNYAYVTSYAGPVKIDPNARLGYVARFDTANIANVKPDTCVVGYQPNGMVVIGNKLYVSNSGGYRTSQYDNRVMVIDIPTFKVVNTIEVGINLGQMVADSRGMIYVASMGNHKDIPSMTYVIDSNTDEVVKELPLLPNNCMALCGDSLYVISGGQDSQGNTLANTFVIYDTAQERVVTRKLIKDGTDKDFTVPYGLAVNPETREILITDAKDYVTPGVMHCYSPAGIRQWSVTTGDIPAHFAFTYRALQPLNR